MAHQEHQSCIDGEDGEEIVNSSTHNLAKELNHD